MKAVLLSLGVALLAVLVCANGLAAGPAAPPPTGIAPATVITLQNWRSYRQFMSAGLAALFEGRPFWHLPPDLRIAVGPTLSIPLPKKYQDDTLRYSSQVKLIQTSSGGYVPKGYVAGVPFPHPLEGDPALRGQRVFWDAYYRYQPRVQSAPGYSYSLDPYGNMTQASRVRTVFSQLAHLSDQEYPQTVRGGAPYYFARFEEQLAPEQGKYSAILDLIPADPTQLDALYEYIPTLRRSLSLSQAARCSPVFGGDYLIDDEGAGPPGLPQLFQIDYLGEKKILALEHASPQSFDSPGTDTQLAPRYYYSGGVGIVPFPNPAMGKWELRDTYVISLKRLPQFSQGYCYSKRVMYVDTENYFAGQLDLYGSSGSLYKAQLVFLYPTDIPATRGDVAELSSGPNTSLLVNFHNKHVTVLPYLRPCTDSQCAKDGYLNVGRYASPGGLMQILQ